MKETTKKKIKKVARVLAIVLGGVLATIGVICSAALLSKCGSAAEQKKPVVLARREADIAPDSRQPQYYFPNVNIADWTDTQVKLHHHAFAYFYAFTNLPAGKYLFQCDGYVDLWRCNDSEQVQNSLTALGNVSQDDDPSSIYSVFASSDNPFYRRAGTGLEIVFQVESSVNGFFFNLFSDSYTFRFVNVLEAQAVVSYTFPIDFFPYQPLSGSSPMFPLISWQSPSPTIGTYQYRELDGLYFTSNGKLYDRIRFDYINAQGSAVMMNGEVQTIQNDDYWRVFSVYYGTAQNPQETAVLRTKFNMDGNGNVYVEGVYWESQVYRTIDVRYWVPNANVTWGTQSRTPEEWLNIIVHSSANGASIGVVLGGDSPFDLFSTAFSSWLPILNIGVLPGISFGLLLFLPIIAGVIVLIVRVVKK